MRAVSPRIAGWAVVEVFADVGRSAYKANVRRPAFESMVEAVTAGEIDTVIVWKLDRISRSVRDFSNFSHLLGDHGAEFVSVTEGFDTTTGIGKAMITITSAFAELESDVKSERIRDALAYQRARGSATNGPRPFGLSADRKTVDKAEAKLLREAAKRVIGGDSLREIVRDWNGRGIVTARGGEWGRRGLAFVLANPTTAGLRTIDGSLVAGTMPGALDRATWDQLQTVLSDPARRMGTTNTTLHLLTGVVRCGACGAPMAAKPHREGWRYVCAPRKGYEACGRVSIDGAKVDHLVSGAVVAVISESDAVHKAGTPSRSGAKPAATSIDDDLEALAADFGAGLLSRREWMAARAGARDSARRAGIRTGIGSRLRGVSETGDGEGRGRGVGGARRHNAAGATTRHSGRINRG